MGFDYGIYLSLEYCVPIKINKASFWYMLKRFAEYEPGHVKRSHQAMAAGDALAKILPKHASVIVLTDSNEYDEEEVNREVETPTPLENRFHYNERIQGEAEFELEYNAPELLSEAFEYAASKLLGDGHGISLRLTKGGEYGEADAPAKETALFMTYKNIKVEPGGDGINVSRGSSNIPWGVLAMTVPPAPPGVAQDIQRLLGAFGMEGEGEVGWRVITVAGGG